MGSRCQFSGWMILLVLGILVILLALITICTVSMLCAPGRKAKKRKDSSKSSTKSNLNTTSLTISDSSSSSFDLECNSQFETANVAANANANNSQKHHHHNQFNNQANRQRRASEFVNDRRSSFANTSTTTAAANRQSIKQPAFNIIHATPPPHTPKETQKIQFIDTVTEIPYDRDIIEISSLLQKQQQQQIPTANKIYNTERRRSSKIINQDRLLKQEQEDNEMKFEFYDLSNDNNHVYNTIDEDENLNFDKIKQQQQSQTKKENTTQTPITHVHNIYASDGELRIESEAQSPSLTYLQLERRSIGSQTELPSVQTSDPALAYLSAINLKQNLKQLEFEQQKARLQKKSNLQQLSSATTATPVFWF